ncbi:MAG: orotidine-5'-phosphate decarboxylase [Actinobacteria bacterium]|nr:orotidine-5'-phosphate decarboxylase [Actinomycetota bacterium]MCZ6567333.1 orotidine-5'-phosphate decarboxylase [Actinomycetota bacterium]
MVNPILVALDVSDLARAERLARSLDGYVGGFKVGLELLMGEGPESVSRIAGLGLPVFADAKLHDIPNTTERAARQLAAHGARWITAHATGGSRMIEAAASGLAAGSEGRKVGVLAVTVLTSLDQTDLKTLGMPGSVRARSVELARLARRAGAEGVICSPLEVASVKKLSPQFLVVTPGIRPGGSAHGDQKRTATPVEALRAGADFIVVGRAITEASDPVASATSILESLRSAALL